MHNGLPHDAWFFILIMVAIILALLWNDKVSGGSSGSGSRSESRTGTGGKGGTTTDRSPEISAYHKGDQHVGGSFGVRGRFDSGSASNFDISANLNGSSVRVETKGSGRFETEEVNVQKGENKYKVKITTSVGKDSDSGGFEAREEEGGDSKEPIVRVTDQNVDSSTGSFRLVAEARSRSEADIEATGFVRMKHVTANKNMINPSRPEDSDYLNRGDRYVLEDSGIGPGVIQYTAWTRDEDGRTGTYSDNFEIEPVREGGGREGSGPGGDGPDIDIEYGDGGDEDGSEDDTSDGSPDGGPDSGDEREGDLNEGKTDSSMAERGLLLGEDIKHLKQAENAVMELERLDEKEIEELEKLKKLLLTADKLVQQLKAEISTHTEGEGYNHLLEIISDTEMVLREFNSELKKLKAEEEKFAEVDEKVNSAISETSDHLENELDAEIEKVDSKYPDQDVENQVRSGSHGARNVSSVVANVIDESYP